MIRNFVSDNGINAITIICIILGALELVAMNTGFAVKSILLVLFFLSISFIPKRFKEVYLLFSTAVCMFGMQHLIVYDFSESFLRLTKISRYADPDKIIEHISFIANIFPIVFSVLLCYRFWNKLEEDIKAKEFNGSAYPTLMVAQGTFYTFLGVSVILFTYNASPDNVVNLLTGLKMAFITSVIGLIFSIAAKLHLKQKVNEFYLNKKFIDEKFLDELDFYKTIKHIGENEDELLRRSINNEYSQMESNNELLRENIEVLRSLSDNLSTAIDKSIKKNNEELVRNMKVVTKELTNSVQQVFAELQDNMKKIEENCSSINERMIDVSTTADTMGKNIERNFEDIGEETARLKDSFVNVQKGYIDAFSENNKVFADMIQCTKENMEHYNSDLNMYVANTDENIEKLNNCFVNLAQHIDSCIDYADLLGKEITNSIGLNNVALQQCLVATKDNVKKINDEFGVMYNKMDKCIEYVDLLAGETVDNIKVIKNEYVQYNKKYTKASQELAEKNAALLGKIEQCSTSYIACQASLDAMTKEVIKKTSLMEDNLARIANNIKYNGDEYSAAVNNAQRQYYKNLEGTINESVDKTMKAIRVSVDKVCDDLRYVSRNKDIN